MFAQTLIDDFHLPSHFRLKIVTAINDQVTEYKDLLARSTRSSALEGVMSTRGKLEEEEEKWWNKIKEEGKSLGKKAAREKVLLAAANGVGAVGGGGGGGGKGKGRVGVVESEDEKEEEGKGEEDEKMKAERPMTVGELGPKSTNEFGHDEMRITIQVSFCLVATSLPPKSSEANPDASFFLSFFFFVFRSNRSTSRTDESTSRIRSNGMRTDLIPLWRSLRR